MPYRTTVTGKISRLKRIDWKEKGEDRVGVEFTTAEPTGRKHPEGHPYAGKSVIEWTQCKSFNDAQAEMILKRFKDGDYITIDGELRASNYDRQSVDVLVPRTGQDPLKLKATVPDYPAYEFIIDRVHFVTDAPEGYQGGNNTPVVEDSTASELEAIAQAQAAASAGTNANASQVAASQEPASVGATSTGGTPVETKTPPF